MGWLAGWSHRKTVTITGQSGAGCPTDDALILTPNGLKYPSELKKGDSIISHEGTKKVLHNSPDYENEVFEIDVVGGHKLKFSKNHRLPTNRGILRAFELKEGDILFEPFTNERLFRQTAKNFKTEVLEKYFTEAKRRNQSEAYERSFYELNDCDIGEILNDVITEKDLYLAEMLGISDAEGKPRRYKTQRSIGYSLNISINEEEVEFLNRIKYLCKELWHIQPKVTKPHNKYYPNSKGINVACKTIAGKELLPFRDISIKEKFLFKNIKLLEAYCKGFWCGDGCELNGYKEVGQSEVNDDLKRFQIYLQLLGHRSSRFNSLNKKTGNREWKVKSYKQSRMQFSRKITKVKRIKERTRIWRLAVEDEHYIFNGLLSLNSNYQVNLSIGDASGGDFHLENHCTSFPNDITVTDNDQTTLLDHWVEDLTVDPISMWVEVADDLASNVDICIYYDKSGESSASNDDNTFLFADDFPGTSLDTGKWTVDAGIPSVSGGILTLLSSKISTQSTFGVSVAMRSQFRLPTARGETGGPYGGEIGFKTDGTVRALIHSWRADYWYATVDNLAGDSMTVGYDTSFHIFEAKRLSTNVNEFRIDDVGIDKTRSDTMSGYIAGYTNVGTETNWFTIRKYQATEPAFSSAGSEENAPVGAIMNQFQGANLGADLYNGALII